MGLDDLVQRKSVVDHRFEGAGGQAGGGASGTDLGQLRDLARVPGVRPLRPDEDTCRSDAADGRAERVGRHASAQHPGADVALGERFDLVLTDVVQSRYKKKLMVMSKTSGSGAEPGPAV